MHIFGQPPPHDSGGTFPGVFKQLVNYIHISSADGGWVYKSGFPRVGENTEIREEKNGHLRFVGDRAI